MRTLRERGDPTRLCRIVKLCDDIERTMACACAARTVARCRWNMQDAGHAWAVLRDNRRPPRLFAGHSASSHPRNRALMGVSRRLRVGVIERGLAVADPIRCRRRDELGLFRA